MMNTASLLYVLALLAICKAEFNANEYVNDKIQDINSWHMLFPRRALEGEQQTTNLANSAAQDVTYSLEVSLTTMVSFLQRELNIALMMMDGTPAQGCVNGIAGFMDNAVVQALFDYNDCSGDIQSTLSRLFYTLKKKMTNYQELFEKTTAGIGECAKTYPNVGSKNRLTMCVDSWFNRYMGYANQSMFNTSNSQAMNLFQNIVGGCAETAATDVISKGHILIDMLARCSKISGNSDYESYESQLEFGYSKSLQVSNIQDQIRIAKDLFSIIEIELNSELLRYYDFRRRASANYEIQSKNETYYANMISEQINNYWTSVASTTSDHPAQALCGISAQQSLTDITTNGSLEAMNCAQSTVNQTRSVLETVEDEMVKLIMSFPSYGNPSLLSCFRQGYIFANNTILGCFHLAITEFNIKMSEAYEIVLKNVDILRENEQLLTNNTLIPCGRSILRRVRLECDRTLFNYQRCLYQESGTNYEVTTPSSSTATDEPFVNY